MGSPVSPIVSNPFMENFESKALATFPQPVKFWGRYLDDTFIIIKSALEEQFTAHLNAQQPSTKFTR